MTRPLCPRCPSAAAPCRVCALTEERDVLRAALEESLDLHDDVSTQAPDYFQDKYEYAPRRAKLEAVLARTTPVREEPRTQAEIEAVLREHGLTTER